MKKTFFMLIVVFTLSSCAALLPSAKTVVHSPWENFDDAKAAFDSIILNKTTTAELKVLGFDAFSTPNIKIRSYLDIVGIMPAVKEEALDVGIVKCIKAKLNCLGYEFEPKSLKIRRMGNFWLDLFNFRRRSQETGWQFKALVVVVDGTVVYKLWGGNPTLFTETQTTNPLGPLQESGGAIINRLWPL